MNKSLNLSGSSGIIILIPAAFRRSSGAWGIFSFFVVLNLRQINLNKRYSQSTRTFDLRMPFLTLSGLSNENSQTLSRDSFQRRGKNAFMSMPTKVVMKLYALSDKLDSKLRKILISATKKICTFFSADENFYKVWSYMKEKILKFLNKITKIWHLDVWRKILRHHQIKWAGKGDDENLTLFNNIPIRYNKVWVSVLPSQVTQKF